MIHEITAVTSWRVSKIRLRNRGRGTEEIELLQMVHEVEVEVLGEVLHVEREEEANVWSGLSSIKVVYRNDFSTDIYEKKITYSVHWSFFLKMFFFVFLNHFYYENKVSD